MWRDPLALAHLTDGAGNRGGRRLSEAATPVRSTSVDDSSPASSAACTARKVRATRSSSVGAGEVLFGALTRMPANQSVRGQDAGVDGGQHREHAGPHAGAADPGTTGQPA